MLITGITFRLPHLLFSPPHPLLPSSSSLSGSKDKWLTAVPINTTKVGAGLQAFLAWQALVPESMLGAGPSQLISPCSLPWTSPAHGPPFPQLLISATSVTHSLFVLLTLSALSPEHTEARDFRPLWSWSYRQLWVTQHRFWNSSPLQEPYQSCSPGTRALYSDQRVGRGGSGEGGRVSPASHKLAHTWKMWACLHHLSQSHMTTIKHWQRTISGKNCSFISFINRVLKTLMKYCKN